MILFKAFMQSVTGKFFVDSQIILVLNLFELFVYRRSQS